MSSSDKLTSWISYVWMW